MKLGILSLPSSSENGDIPSPYPVVKLGILSLPSSENGGIPSLLYPVVKLWILSLHSIESGGIPSLYIYPVVKSGILSLLPSSENGYTLPTQLVKMGVLFLPRSENVGTLVKIGRYSPYPVPW